MPDAATRPVPTSRLSASATWPMSGPRGEPRPDLGSGHLGRGQLGGDQFRGVGREVKVGQVLVQVVRNADDGHVPTLTDGANTER